MPTPPAVPAPLPLLLRPAAAVKRRVVEAPPRWLFGTLGGLFAWLAAMRLGTGANRPEEFIMAGLMIALAVWSDRTRAFLRGTLPLFLYGIAYDLTHITQPLVRHLYVHVKEPYQFDLRFFGIETAAGRITPNELFRTHHWPAVDLVAGVAYIIFIYWAIAFAAYLAIFRRDEAGRRLLSRFVWTFLFMNLAGFATYYVYPAAPPWYAAQYGFGPADFSAQASAAAALRFDELLGITYFKEFYSRAADVFGAIPSLHVAYPLITFLYGLELGKRWLHVASFALYLVVAFSAVYLDHHYVLDVLIGTAYVLVAWGAERATRGWRERRAAARALPA
jgi:inositol phosphorylceramide synthase catalytic subunit